MKKLVFIMLLCTQYSFAQFKDQLSPKVSIAINANLETYFFAEKLAVEHMNDFVFDHKGWDYSHQPIVHFGFLHFKEYTNMPVIKRLATLFSMLKDRYHDNAPILSYLVNQQQFPSEGYLFQQDTVSTDQLLFREITDSLRSFYQLAAVGDFLRKNAAFYHGALKEVEKDIYAGDFPALEKWYGKTFNQYCIFLAPGMPITKGEDNYRGVGPKITSGKGNIPAMIMSPNRPLTLLTDLDAYKQYGYDNRNVTRFLTKHEMGHSFVNPLLEKFSAELIADSALFTPALKQALAPHYINNWQVCVIEHLVRLAEIRTALAMHEPQEATRLRRLHIYGEKCVLLPLLEIEIREYERNRKRYPDFESYLPLLIRYFHSLTPALINAQVKKVVQSAL